MIKCLKFIFFYFKSAVLATISIHSLNHALLVFCAWSILDFLLDGTTEKALKKENKYKTNCSGLKFFADVDEKISQEKREEITLSFFTFAFWSFHNIRSQYLFSFTAPTMKIISLKSVCDIFSFK